MGTITTPDQGELFLFDVASAPVKDLMDCMEHPFYGLSKKPEMQAKTYRHGDVALEMVPSRKGLPTIYDKDLLIYAVSRVAAGIRAGKVMGPRVDMRSAEVLAFTGRRSDGRAYQALEDALERLAGTLIKTTLRAPGGAKDVAMFHLVDMGHLTRREGLGLTGCTITLSSWIFEAIEANAILTLHPDYFRLRRPLEKRLYEIARKHCGRQVSWRINLDTLHKKSGAASPLRNFRVAVKAVARTDHLPDYRMTYDQDADQVTFRARDGGAKAAAAVALPHLGPDTPESARRILPGVDPYALESEWREWAGAAIAAGNMSPPTSADQAFLGFVRTRAKAMALGG